VILARTLLLFRIDDRGGDPPFTAIIWWVSAGAGTQT
jgi:hypothetical protein